MKKIVSVAVAALMTMPAFAAPSHITKDTKGGYNVTYDYKDKEKTNWYATVRAELSFLNWTNKYSSDDPVVDEMMNKDEYSFEPVFGGSLAFGHRINYFWRAEVEAGFIGYFKDSGDGASFEMSIPYAMLNGYYDFNNGLYLGAGVGLALPMTTIDIYLPTFDMAGNSDHTGFGVMGGLMAGWSHKLDDNIVLDLRYRLAGITGTKHKLDMSNGYYVQSKANFILDNSISVGLRYEF